MPTKRTIESITTMRIESQKINSKQDYITCAAIIVERGLDDDGDFWGKVHLIALLRLGEVHPALKTLKWDGDTIFDYVPAKFRTIATTSFYKHEKKTFERHLKYIVSRAISDIYQRIADYQHSDD